VGPQGLGGDPAAAFSGAKVLGNTLGGKGTYKAARTVYADSPVIDLQGEERVRLQVRRWLTVQDGFYDQANIYVNGMLVWENGGTDENDGSLDHRDLEWRFEDIDLRPYLLGAKTAQIRFEIAANGSKQLGGFTLDDFRIVAFHPPRKILSFAEAPAPAPAVEPPALDLAGGCTCGVAGSSSSAGTSLAALGALGLAAMRRRRR
jgi:MYXO-CTERM domain-containing protein